MSEPWRLVCTKCGSVSIKRCRGDSRRLSSYDHWYCRGCDSSTPRAYDKKHGVEVSP